MRTGTSECPAAGRTCQYQSPRPALTTDIISISLTDAVSASVSLTQDRMPLAVVGSNVVVEVNGRKVRGRQYPWGVAEGVCQVWSVWMCVCKGFVLFFCNACMCVRVLDGVIFALCQLKLP